MAAKKPATKSPVKDGPEAKPAVKPTVTQEVPKRVAKASAMPTKTKAPAIPAKATAETGTTTAPAPKKAPRKRAGPDSGAALAPAVVEISAVVRDRDRLVAEAAYYRAERRGFAPGSELEDWLEAEAEIVRLLGG